MEELENKYISNTKKIIDYTYLILIFCITYLTIRMNVSDYWPHLGWLPLKKDFLHPFSYFANNAEPLWHFCTKILSKSCKIPVKYAGAVVCGICNLITYKILVFFFKNYSEKYATLIAFVCMILGPLYVPWFSKNIYLGQGTPNVWHNPTTLIVRPFAILITIKSIEIMKAPFPFSDYKNRIKDMLILSILILFSTFAKPSFIQIYFPSIFVFCVVKTISSKGKFFPNSVYLLICCLLAFFVLLIQFYLLFINNTSIENSEPAISLKFLYVMKLNSKNPFVSQFFVIAFPITILISKIIFKINFSNLYRFSWIMYVFAFLEASLFVENSRAGHGNFTWSLVLSYNFLFIVAFIDYLSMLNSFYKNNRIKILCLDISSLILCCHVFIGIIYIYQIIFLGSYY